MRIPAGRRRGCVIRRNAPRRSAAGPARAPDAPPASGQEGCG